MFRGFRFKLCPTPSHEREMVQFNGACRLAYNLAWEQRRDFWRQYKRKIGRHISFPSQSKELTDLRREYDWLAAVPRSCLERTLREVDRAFANFFAGRSGYPKPRRKGDGESVKFDGAYIGVRKLNAKWGEVRLPKIGWVKFRRTRDVRGSLMSVAVTKDDLGWNVVLLCRIEENVAQRLPLAVGIDRGVANTLALSTGEMLSLPNSLEGLDRRKRRAQRALARKRKGSNRRKKALQRVATLSARGARIRRDWHHKTALAVAKRFGCVCMEDLKVGSMTASAAGTLTAPGRSVRQKAGLNRAILNQGWYAFEAILAYKLEERGGSLVKVPAAYTSQTCSDCGVIDTKSRESQAVFWCRHCGFTAHADHNAALNILRRNTSAMRVEDGHLTSVEARTGSGSSVENRAAEAA